MNTYLQWLLLIILSAITALVMMWIQLPGALLLGPMAAGIVWSLYGGTLQVPRKLFLCAQAIIGCLVARSISPDMLSTFSRHWSLFLAIVCSTIAASSLMGWVISKLKVLPGTTAIWGSSPGAAAAMVLMAEEFGADARLVAFMQYLRVIIVAGGASLIARLWIDTNSATAAPIIWFPPLHWSTLETIALAASGIMLARLCRIPSGAMLVPMMLGMALQSKNLIQIDLPEWLLSIAAIRQTSASISDVSRNTEEASHKAKESVLIVNAGQARMNEMVEIVSRISSNSEKINRITDVIEKIANKTNLLSLNAAIEAARAGEHGRGFAVVAEEVGKLAASAAESTREIMLLAEHAVKEARHAVSTVNEVSAEMQQISEGALQTDAMLQRISAALEEQSAAVQEVNANITGLSKVAESNATAAEEITATVFELAKIADNTRQEAERFRL